MEHTVEEQLAELRKQLRYDKYNIVRNMMDGDVGSALVNAANAQQSEQQIADLQDTQRKQARDALRAARTRWENTFIKI